MTVTTPDNRPIVRLADGFRRLTGWRRNLTAIAAGIVASISLPPPTRCRCFGSPFQSSSGCWMGCRRRKAPFGSGGSSDRLSGLQPLLLTFALFVAIDQYWWLVPFASSGAWPSRWRFIGASAPSSPSCAERKAAGAHFRAGGDVEPGGMGARPCADRLPLELAGLCLD